MPSLFELIRFIAAEQALELDESLIAAIRARYAGERVYIPPPQSRRDPARAARIRRQAARLPTRVVAAREGVSEQYVRKVVKKTTT